MSTQSSLFLHEELLILQAQMRRCLIATAKLPWVCFLIALFAAGLIFVSLLEWEIVYQVFDFLVGDDTNTWSPGLMACTGLVMIIGYHLHAQANPDNFSVRFVNKAASFLIPVYLLGMGLLTASILYRDGLGEMVAPEAKAVIGAIAQAAEDGVIDTIFTQAANPLAVLAFSLGIGSLAIINIFVAHKLLTMIIENLSQVIATTQTAKEAIKDHKIILRSQAEYAALEMEENDLLMRDDNYIGLSIVGVVLSEISSAILPHRKLLKEHEYALPNSRFEAQEPVDTKRVTKDIARIAAISQKDIMNALKPCLLEKSL